MIVLDTGALLALDKDDRKMWSRVNEMNEEGLLIVVPLGALAQAWRGGPRQARLALALKGMEEVSFDKEAKDAGILCGRAGTSDVVDASVALTAAAPGATRLYTSDRSDLGSLLKVLGSSTRIIEI